MSLPHPPIPCGLLLILSDTRCNGLVQSLDAPSLTTQGLCRSFLLSQGARSPHRILEGGVRQPSIHLARVGGFLDQMRHGLICAFHVCRDARSPHISTPAAHHLCSRSIFLLYTSHAISSHLSLAFWLGISRLFSLHLFSHDFHVVCIRACFNFCIVPTRVSVFSPHGWEHRRRCPRAEMVVLPPIAT